LTPELTATLRAELRTLAREAVLEVTDASAIGSDAGENVEPDGSISVLFDSALSGYPGWKWTVSMAALDGLPVSVLEVELIPSTGALLSPDWVPWIDRLAEYEAAQDALVAAGDIGDDDTDDDELPMDLLHGGDFDGVDIDALDDDDESDESDESDDDDDESDDDDDESDDDESDDDDDESDDDESDDANERSY
jgi:hypothetical protein